MDVVRKVFEELKFLLFFEFKYDNKPAQILVFDNQFNNRKEFSVLFNGNRTCGVALNAAIRLIVEKRNRRNHRV